ncbi:MAG TPA: hypothetical protein VMU10_09310 [Desulfomonilia bacterium]|nr:hypothetical protein [Desulfomonilia bacterium]
MFRLALAVFIILFLILSQASHAAEDTKQGVKGGFSGSITIGAAYITGTFSNLEYPEHITCIHGKELRQDTSRVRQDEERA